MFEFTSTALLNLHLRHVIDKFARRLQALEVAEKALNKTDYLSHIEQRRQKHLTQLYNQRDVDRPQESNLTST